MNYFGLKSLNSSISTETGLNPMTISIAQKKVTLNILAVQIEGGMNPTRLLKALSDSFCIHKKKLILKGGSNMYRNSKEIWNDAAWRFNFLFSKLIKSVHTNLYIIKH